MTQSPRIQPFSRPCPAPSLRTIQATDNEIIVVLAALQHYQTCDRHLNPQASASAIPMIQSFIQRLHDQLPAFREQPAR